MSNKEKPDLKVVDFTEEKKKRELHTNVPMFLLDKLVLLCDAAKDNKLKSIILHFDYENEEDELDGGTLLWSHNKDVLKLLALCDLIHDEARQRAIFEIFDDYEEED